MKIETKLKEKINEEFKSNKPLDVKREELNKLFYFYKSLMKWK